MTTTRHYDLQVQTSLLDEAKRSAAEDGTSIDQFFDVAIAEKAAVLRTAAYFRERSARADLPGFDRILAKAGREPPRVGDESPSVAQTGSGRWGRVSHCTLAGRWGRVSHCTLGGDGLASHIAHSKRPLRSGPCPKARGHGVFLCDMSTCKAPRGREDGVLNRALRAKDGLRLRFHTPASGPATSAGGADGALRVEGRGRKVWRESSEDQTMAGPDPSLPRRHNRAPRAAKSPVAHPGNASWGVEQRHPPVEDVERVSDTPSVPRGRGHDLVPSPRGWVWGTCGQV